MQVKDLIEELQKYDPETVLVTPGYEGGLDYVRQVEEIIMALNVNDAWYYGDHEEVDSDDDSHKSCKRTKAVKIS